MSENDIVMAFFPCVRFEAQIILGMRGDATQQKKWDTKKKLEYSMKLNNELNEMYELISKLALICIERKIPLIIENPWNEQHYLHRYWPLKPSVIDKDRTRDGDHFIKPTQYWFVNCKPKNNMLFEAIEWVDTKTIANTRNQVERSLIHPQYANRFIRQYITGGKE